MPPPGAVAAASGALVDALPDLALLVSRDGMVVAHGGGRDMVGLGSLAKADGKPLQASWPAPIASLLGQLTRKSIAQRMAAEARFKSSGSEYTVQVSPRGPDRAVCVIRPVVGSVADDASDTGGRPAPRLDRRGFLQRFKESMSWAALRETPMALAVIHIDGITDIAQVLASQISEQVMSVAIRRLPAPPDDARSAAATPQWYLGQLSRGIARRS